MCKIVDRLIVCSHLHIYEGYSYRYHHYFMSFQMSQLWLTLASLYGKLEVMMTTRGGCATSFCLPFVCSSIPSWWVFYSFMNMPKLSYNYGFFVHLFVMNRHPLHHLYVVAHFVVISLCHSLRINYLIQGSLKSIQFVPILLRLLRSTINFLFNLYWT